LGDPPPRPFLSFHLAQTHDEIAIAPIA